MGSTWKKWGIYWNKGLWLAVCAVLICAAASAQKAVASLQPERIETGDTTTLLLFVTGLNQTPGEVDFGPWALMLPANNIIGRSEWRRSGTQWTRRFTLIAFDSASLDLPPLLVKNTPGNPLETNSLHLLVFPTPGGREITDMSGIRDIKREAETWEDYLVWIALVLVLLLALLWWLRKSRRPVVQTMSMQTPPAPPPLSPSELALQKLEQLAQKQYWKNGNLKEHYAELSLILREYMESQWAFPALESTTAEIAKALKTKGLDPAWQKEINELLQSADMVKYAQSVPADNKHQQVLENARRLINPNQAMFQNSQPKPQHSPKSTPAPPSSPRKYEPL